MRPHLRTALLAAAVTGGLLVPAAATAAPTGPARPAPPAKLASVPGSEVPAKAVPVDRTREVTQPLPARWPAAGTAEIALAAGTSASPAGTAAAITWAAGLPLGVAPANGGATTSAAAPQSAPTRLRLELLSHADAAKAGRDVLLRVSRADGVASAGRARIALNYGGFRDAYGGDWSGRLTLVSLPDCALRTPAAAVCQPTALPTSNDRRARTLTADTAVTPAGALVALAAGPASDNGDYTATELKASSSWTAGGSSGDFAWQYPLRVPPSLNGPAPQVNLGYSAQSVDGQTAAVNAQPSWLGEGFDWQPGSIVRAYRGCTDDGKAMSGDLCWAGDNAVLSLNGQSTELVLDAANGWRPKDEDGSKVEKVAGAVNGDNDGEYWKVTSTDGTQYFFGLNRLPGWRPNTSDPETNSVAYVPVFGNNANEPCSTAPGWCPQAYQWNLDYVVDPHGNTMSLFYQRELNSYARNRVATDVSSYVRAEHVREIDYGTRQDAGADSVFAGAAPAKVTFGVTNRCVTAGSTCTLTTANAGNWPDVPVDQVCTGTSCPNQFAPTFFTSTKLSTVTTLVASGTAAWRRVEQWTLTQAFKDPGDGLPKILWLKQLDHCGTDNNTCLPATTFMPTPMSNRVDTAGTPNSIIRYRMLQITTDSGGTISITYSAPECVAGSTMPASPDTNTKRCFPAYWIPPGATAPKLEYFHKYRVEQVAAGDQVDSTDSDQVTSYTYLGAPAWHYTNSGIGKPERRTWDQWRGYQTVRTISGASTETQSEVDTTYFRGLDGDKTASGTRSATVPDSDAGSWVDSDWFAGTPRETVTMNGPGGAVVSKTKNDPYVFGPTATQSLNGMTLKAYVTDTAVGSTKTALDGNRGWRTTRITTGFVADRTGRVSQVDDEGEVSTATDDRCTRTTYAANTAGTMLALASRVETVAVRCGATPDRTKDVISDVRTWYDGATSYATTVSRGDATRVENLTGYSGSTPQYAQASRATYDTYGRTMESYDELDHLTKTAYTGTPLTQTAITNPKGYATTTDIDPAWGLPLTTTDQNTRRTDLAYDGLGRLTSVWLPGRDKASQLPDQRFSYDIHNAGGPTVVSSSRLNTAGRAFLTQYTLYDGWLRERQHQAPAVGGGRLIDETRYDSRGLAAKDRPAYFNANAPSGTLFQPTGDVAVPEQMVTVYDGDARPTAAITQVDAVEKWRTSTAYGGDHTDVTAPVGGTGTSTWTDARGQVTAVWQYHGNPASGAHDTTSRTYTPAGDLATATDAAGNTWTASYDQRRRRIEERDPNRGKTTYTYDNAGNMLTSTDARDITRVFRYDELDRPIDERLSSATGPLLAAYTYDSLPGGLGKSTSSTSYDDAGNAYTDGISGYTARYQPTGTTTTIPASAGMLAGTYTTATSYNADGTAATTTEPARTDTANFGGLPDETLRYGYNDLGMPTTMSGTSSYVTDTQYQQTGQLSSVTQTDGTKSVIQYLSYEHGTNRLAQHQVVADIPTVIAAETNYSYDPAGNITKIADTLAHEGAGPDDTQCLKYDYLARLTDAWTPASGDCTTAPATGSLGGPAPYWNTYALDGTGNRTGAVTRTPAGTSSNTYNYPAAPADQPHSLSTVTTTGTGAGTSSFGYDAAGDTTGRSVPGRPSQTLTWNADQRLASITDSTGRTDYAYTADGDRLLQKDSAGATLYLDRTECRATGSSVSCIRPYDYLGSGTVAVRGPAGLAWQVTDHQGTPQYSFRASDMAQAQRRTTPFGTERGSSPAWPSTAGFVNGTKDASGLTHVGAREYDPALGRFTSVDPLFTMDDSQSWHGYAYADNTPVTNSDPTGLRTEDQFYGRGGKDKDFGGSSATGAGGWSGSCDGHHSASNCDDDGHAKAPPPHKPKDIVSKTTYHHGTVLIVYYDGTVTVNGHRVPNGVKDTDALAQSVDRQAPDDPPDPHASNNGWPIHGLGGFCLGAGGQAFAAYTRELCFVADKNGVAELTNTVDPTENVGVGASFGVHLDGMWSPDARDASDLSGPFTYGNASISPVDVSAAEGSASDGHKVHVVQAGPAAGLGDSASVGTSRTTVDSTYLWHWPKAPWAPETTTGYAHSLYGNWS